jgi:lysophospholipase L1-like esterase
MTETTVFIGDSVTDCGRLELPPFGDGYVRNIANSGKLAGNIINVGTSGNRLVDLIARWDEDVLFHNPTRVSIAIGINDTWRRYDDNDITSIEDFQRNYDEVLAKTKVACNPEFVLCEPFLLHVNPEMKTWREDLDPKIEAVHSLAKKYDAKLVPFDEYLNGLIGKHTIEELADDGIHPSALGHKLMAESWLAKVVL